MKTRNKITNLIFVSVAFLIVFAGCPTHSVGWNVWDSGGGWSHAPSVGQTRGLLQSRWKAFAV